MKRAVLAENWKLIVLLILVLLIVVGAGIWIGCKFPDFSRCTALFKSGGSTTSGNNSL